MPFTTTEGDTMQTTEYRIEMGPQPEGPHWDSMRPADAHLAETLDDLAAYLAISRGESNERTDQVLSDAGIEPDDDGNVDIHEVLERFALEVQTAAWTSEYSTGRARVVYVLGTGGPHVEIDVLYDHHGKPELVTLNRYWSGSSTATTTDTRALDIAGEFGDLFLGEIE